MNGYLLLNGNVITEANTGVPADGWTSSNYVPVPEMVVDPATLVGKFYNPRGKRVYDTYNPRSGMYSSSVAVTESDKKAIDIKNAETVIEIKACNWMLRFINDAIQAGVPITKDLVPEYVIIQLDKYLGEGNYEITAL